jgi:hypothetical protein
MPDEWRAGGALACRGSRRGAGAEQDEEVSLRYQSRRDLAKLDLPIDIVVGDRSQPYFHRIARHL